jgi:transcriptional regulator with XRE-family HTH domain
MQDDKKSFVRALSSLLSYRGLSQRELADKIGCTEAAVSAWLKGKSSPTQKRLHKIAEALRVDVAYLIGDFPLFDENGLPNFEPDPIKQPTAAEVFSRPDYFTSSDSGEFRIETHGEPLDAVVKRLYKYSELINKWEKLSDKERDNVMSYIDFNLSEEGK